MAALHTPKMKPQRFPGNVLPASSSQPRLLSARVRMSERRVWRGPRRRGSGLRLPEDQRRAFSHALLGSSSVSFGERSYFHPLSVLRLGFVDAIELSGPVGDSRSLSRPLGQKIGSSLLSGVVFSLLFP